MRCFSSFKLTVSGGTKTLVFIDLHNKKSQGDKSVLLGGQHIMPYSHLLIVQSKVVVDFSPGNVEPNCTSEAELHLG